MTTRIIVGCVLAGALCWVGCDKRQEPEGELTKNIERSVGEGQKSTGMLGGNNAPVDAGVTETGDAATP